MCNQLIMNKGISTPKTKALQCSGSWLFTQNELFKIQEWCLANKLIINFNKTQQIIFRNSQKKIDIENFEHQDLGIGKIRGCG